MTAQYEPSETAWRRPEWDDELFELVERYLPASESVPRMEGPMLDQLRALTRWRISMPSLSSGSASASSKRRPLNCGRSSMRY